MGNHAESASHYGRSVTLDPEFAQGHQGRGQALLELGLLDEAESGFQTALRISPDLSASWVGLARLQAERGDFDSLASRSAQSCHSSPTCATLTGAWR